MEYDKAIHLAEIRATNAARALVAAQYSDGRSREYHLRDALIEFGKMAEEISDIRASLLPVANEAQAESEVAS